LNVKTTVVFGRVHQNAVPGAKSVIYDFLVWACKSGKIGDFISTFYRRIYGWWQVYWSLEYFNTELTWLKLTRADHVARYRFYWLNAGWFSLTYYSLTPATFSKWATKPVSFMRVWGLCPRNFNKYDISYLFCRFWSILRAVKRLVLVDD